MRSFAAFVSRWNVVRPRVEERLERLHAGEDLQGDCEDLLCLVRIVDRIVVDLSIEVVAPAIRPMNACLFVRSWTADDPLADLIWSLTALYAVGLGRTPLRTPIAHGEEDT